jgi:hypothetical protein
VAGYSCKTGNTGGPQGEPRNIMFEKLAWQPQVNARRVQGALLVHLA